MSTTARPKQALGRGLGSLLTSAKAPDDAAGPFLEIEVERIIAMPDQPRRHFDESALTELSESIRVSGIIQPLLVRRAGDKFELIAGERRLRAARMAGVLRVPAIVRDVTEEERFVLALVENIQRRDLNPIEEAAAYSRLIDDHRLTQEELAQRVGKSRPAIANALRLLQLSSAVRTLIAEETLSAGHARAVLSAPEAWRDLLAERIVTESLTVRNAEELSRAVRETGKLPGSGSTPGTTGRASRAPRPPTAPARELRPQLKLIERNLMDALGTRVTLVDNDGKGGTVTIEYADNAMLQAVFDRITGARS